MYSPSLLFQQDYEQWAYDQFFELTDQVNNISPSEWAEQTRYLPSSVSPIPGFYSYDITPYLREIVDCADIRSPIREVSMMKGAQIGATVGTLENIIGYGIDVVKSAPMMLLTADGELAQLRMEQYIQPMIQQSDLFPLITSADETNKRRSGMTQKKIEWFGGGFLVPFGANNANKLRSISMRFLLEDEIDGFVDNIGKQGCPSKLAEGRTKAFHNFRKIYRISTPLIKGISKIEKAFKEGDQRYYFVPCKKCGEKQILKFRGVNKETGEVYGLVWEMDENNHLLPDTVRYHCQFCSHPHTNSDKTFMLPRGEWQPTAKPSIPDIRSYHLSSLYAPASMFPWSAMVSAYLKGWDMKRDEAIDINALQEFYNNNLGEPFEIRGDRLKMHEVSRHKRDFYRYGNIPNKAIADYGGPIEALICAVDVHKRHLNVSIMGFTANLNPYLIDYFYLEGDCENLEDPDTWKKLEEIIESNYTDDTGRTYHISNTGIDQQYNTDIVLAFCEMYESGVYPLAGKASPNQKQAIREFNPFVTKKGSIGYQISVDLYKDRYAPVLRRSWDGLSIQKPWTFNCPKDITKQQLKELTTEYKRVKETKEGRRIGYEWYRPPGVPNELWDLLVYSTALLEIMAWDVMCNQREQEIMVWAEFWDVARTDQLYYNNNEVIETNANTQ